jgi:CP12 domain
MKFSLCLFFPAAVSAFAPTTFLRPASTQLHESRPDSSAAVAAALEATKKYGATSPEARVAWDTVEEMDSSDNRYVYSLSASGHSVLCDA